MTSSPDLDNEWFDAEEPLPAAPLHVLSLRDAEFASDARLLASLAPAVTEDAARAVLQCCSLLSRAAASGGSLVLDSAADALSTWQQAQAEMAADKGVPVVHLRNAAGEPPLLAQLEASGLAMPAHASASPTVSEGAAAADEPGWLAEAATAVSQHEGAPSAAGQGAASSADEWTDAEEEEEPAWLVQATSALLRSLPKGSSSSAAPPEDAAALLRAALAQNASMQAVLQSQ
eukprot:6401154-Prymnesium_polylepis.1